MTRKCLTCTKDIAVARIAAVPSAVQCVMCLTKAGDVPPHRDKGEFAHALEIENPKNVLRRVSEGIGLIQANSDWPYADED